ncbi:MAG: GNAT family protein [Bryobacteraceae bacterium]
MHNPFLVGEKVYLRALERGDLSGPMFDWANDPDVTQYMYMGWVPNTPEALEREFNLLRADGTAGLLQLHEHPTTIIFAAVDKQTDVHIGNVGLFDISWVMRVGELRAIIGDRQHWGGFATDAYKLILKYAFDRLNLRRIIAGTRADNVRSIVNLRKLGFVEEGRQREHFLRNEVPYDIVQFGLLRREFFALPAMAASASK